MKKYFIFTMVALALVFNIIAFPNFHRHVIVIHVTDEGCKLHLYEYPQLLDPMQIKDQDVKDLGEFNDLSLLTKINEHFSDIDFKSVPVLVYSTPNLSPQSQQMLDKLIHQANYKNQFKSINFKTGNNYNAAQLIANLPN